uniref:C-type lectin domain-containing protein n=1 Tax=Dicentrarchus labrax TaxID=13489 RepID=A0A8P4KLD0_DICLA
MKMLTVSLLVCAMMAWTTAAAVPEAETGEGTELSIQGGNSHVACPTGWTGYNDRCFIYIPTEMTWADAEKNCQDRGGNLASVHSFEEHQAIQGMILILTQAYPLTWLGGYDAAQEGAWFWSDGTRFQFNFWDEGQPDNRANAHCMLMNFGGKQIYSFRNIFLFFVSKSDDNGKFYKDV